MCATQSPAYNTRPAQDHRTRQNWEGDWRPLSQSRVSHPCLGPDSPSRSAPNPDLGLTQVPGMSALLGSYRPHTFLSEIVGKGQTGWFQGPEQTRGLRLDG